MTSQPHSASVVWSRDLLGKGRGALACNFPVSESLTIIIGTSFNISLFCVNRSTVIEGLGTRRKGTASLVPHRLQPSRLVLVNLVGTGREGQ